MTELNNQPQDAEELTADERRDALAAEFALGVLTLEERAEVAAKALDDRALADDIARWNDELSPLLTDFEDAAPPRGGLAALEQRLFGTGTPTRGPSALSVWFWRILGTGATAALAAVFLFFNPFTAQQAAQQQFIASLSSGEMQVVALYDAGSDALRYRLVSGEVADDRDLELWIIDGSNAPKSMGVINRDRDRAQLAMGPVVQMADLDSEIMTERFTFAVSLEPEGGSPTGNPTGPVLAAGTLTEI